MRTRSDLQIRDVRQGDLKYLLHLNQTSLPHVDSISLDDLKNFQNQSVCFRVAELKGKPAGFYPQN